MPTNLDKFIDSIRMAQGWGPEIRRKRKQTFMSKVKSAMMSLSSRLQNLPITEAQMEKAIRLALIRLTTHIVFEKTDRTKELGDHYYIGRLPRGEGRYSVFILYPDPPGKNLTIKYHD